MEDTLQPYNNDLNKYKKNQLLMFVNLLNKWNKTHNLTSIKKTKDIFDKHLFDSLSIKEFVLGGEVLDVGTGGGFPGIPLSVLFEEKNFTLVDSNQKKIAFLNEVKRQLGLTNVSCLHTRVEDLADKKFDVITTRAFATLSNMLEKTHHLIKQNGVWLAMKGNIPIDEINDLDTSFKTSVKKLLSPRGTNYNRHLVIIKKQG